MFGGDATKVCSPQRKKIAKRGVGLSLEESKKFKSGKGETEEGNVSKRDVQGN